MSDARDLIRNGDVEGALAALKQEVRKAPRDARLRTFLFQLFCVSGEWDRALTQLTTASELDPKAAEMAQAYRPVIRCEVLREKVFRGERSPMILGNPGEWIPLLMESVKLLAAGKSAEAAKLRDAAFEAAPATPGTMDETDFAWIADADPRLGPVLEVFLNGNYMWVPFHRIKSIRFEAPSDLRDQVWMPANFTWINEGEAVGFIPSRYPGSAGTTDLALGRRTDWIEQDDDWTLPVGQRMLATDVEEFALLDVRRIELTGLDALAAASAEAHGDGEAAADADAGTE